MLTQTRAVADPDGLGPSACPRCRAALVPETADALACVAERAVFRRHAGIWRFLDGETDHAAFTAQYRTVRRAEAWGSGSADYYQRLPFTDLSGRHPDIWRIRAVTYRHFLRWVLAPRERERHGGLRILDLGAGNGWLSARLTGRGHQVAAVDLDDDPRDGLGAVVHYGDQAPAESVQASFDHLPWPRAVFDLAIFNGSLHYSPDYAQTLQEALRVLKRAGEVVVLDTPFYAREASGRAMVGERNRRHGQQYGVVAETTRNEAFLTDARLQELGSLLDLTWRVRRPYYGLRWALRPLQNRLLGRREPARFRVVAGALDATTSQRGARG